MVYYYCKFDEEFDSNLFMFGTDDSIANDTLSQLPEKEQRAVTYLKDKYETVDSCEDYLLCVADKAVEAIKTILDRTGFKSNSKLADCGWG